MVNGRAPWGNARLFPRGMLREPLSALEAAPTCRRHQPARPSPTPRPSSRRRPPAPRDRARPDARSTSRRGAADRRSRPQPAPRRSRAGDSSPSRGSARRAASPTRSPARAWPCADFVEFPDHHWYVGGDLARPRRQRAGRGRRRAGHDGEGRGAAARPPRAARAALGARGEAPLDVGTRRLGAGARAASSPASLARAVTRGGDRRGRDRHGRRPRAELARRHCHGAARARGAARGPCPPPGSRWPGRWAEVLRGQGVADVLLPYPRRRRAPQARQPRARRRSPPTSRSCSRAPSRPRSPPGGGARAGASASTRTRAARSSPTPSPLPTPRQHQVDEYARLVQALGIRAEDADPRWTPVADAAAEREVDALLGPPAFRAGARAVGLHLGASFGPSKLWPADRSRGSPTRLARSASASSSWALPRTSARRGMPWSPRRASTPASLVGRDRPALLPRLLARLACLVSGDTGVAHLAAALGVPDRDAVRTDRSAAHRAARASRRAGPDRAHALRAVLSLRRARSSTSACARSTPTRWPRPRAAIVSRMRTVLHTESSTGLGGQEIRTLTRRAGSASAAGASSSPGSREARSARARAPRASRRCDVAHAGAVGRDGGRRGSSRLIRRERVSHRPHAQLGRRLGRRASPRASPGSRWSARATSRSRSARGAIPSTRGLPIASSRAARPSAASWSRRACAPSAWSRSRRASTSTDFTAERRPRAPATRGP